jgi:guanylate kinase
MPVNFERWEHPDQGVLFVVTGASGSGKTTLVQAAFEGVPGLEFSVSATTRLPRDEETDGEDYHFVSSQAFSEARDNGRLLEWAQVYGNHYGTPRGPVEAALSAGRSIILDIDLQGARQVREAYPDVVTIFVLPPDLATLETRLRARSTDSNAVIVRRMDEAMLQIGHCGEFKYLVVNDDLPLAQRVFEGVLLAEMVRTERRPRLVERMTSYER